MAPAPPATLFEKIDAYGVVVKTMLVALTQFLTTPLRSGPRPSLLYKDVMFKAFRYQLASLNLSQEKYMNPSTEANYLDLAKDKGFQPDTLVLPSGCKAHWFGSKSADNIVIYLHGGGYVMPCSPGHNKWLFELTDELSKSFSFSSILLHYTCSPEGQYPTQLRQAAELLDHLITKEGRNPSNIIIAGDSAGGNLAYALLSHILHPHPDVPTKIELKEPLRAAIMISPWVDFNIDQGSFNRNEPTDMLCKEVGERWSDAFIGDAPKDPYNQPVTAPADWFSKLDTVINDLLIWGGGGEVLIDSINKIAEQMKTVFPKTQYVVQPGAGHEDFIIEKLIGYTAKAQGTEVIEEWLSARL